MLIKSRQCALNDLTKDIGAQIQSRISSSDQPVSCFETQQEQGPMWNPDKDHDAYVITRQQLIVYRKRLGSSGWSHLYTMRLDEISSISEGAGSTSEYGYTVAPRSTSGYSLDAKFGTREDASKFTTILESATNQAQKRQRSPEERLRELEQLHAALLISDDEYAQKRKEILEEL